MSPVVVVAEDDPAVLRAIERLLRDKCTVVSALSAAKAVAALRTMTHVDAVWADRSLPEPFGGAEVLATAAELHPRAVLLMVTAEPHLALGLPRGAQVYAKPDLAHAAEGLLGLLGIGTANQRA